MSEEKRDYPEWLDRELFSDLDGSAPEKTAAPAPEQDAPAPKEEKYSGLISFRTDWLDLLAVQGTLKSLLNTTD